METFHILYTDENGKFCNEKRSFKRFELCEAWLKSIKAKYWEIGFMDRDIKSALKEVIKS